MCRESGISIAGISGADLEAMMDAPLEPCSFDPYLENYHL
jgi:hypothetical protein